MDAFSSSARGCPKDTTGAQALYSKAAPKFALAKRYLGRMYLESSDKDQHIQALQYLGQAANWGDTRSMVLLADINLHGSDGVTKNEALAAEWLDRAQRLHDPVASYQRGLLYQKGQGLAKSRAMAAKLFRRSAEAGYPPAEAALGMCYAKGSGVPMDTAQAVHWLTLAAPKDTYAATELKIITTGKAQ